MKLLLVDQRMHTKNFNAIMKYKNIDVVTIDNTDCIKHMDLSEYDCVFSPHDPIDVSMYPSTKFIFGPHFSVFPDDKISCIKEKNSVYIQPSEWVVQLWKSFDVCKNLDIRALPFGVDSEKFCERIPIQERNKVFLYYKRRNPADLDRVKTLLKNNNIEYRIFDYCTRYSEDEYLAYLQNSKYGIWLDAHESQGFALEEALSCNVPLLVWNVNSLDQEYGSNYPHVYATTIPYFDEKCGEWFTYSNELESIFNTFQSKLQQYRPREFVLENICIEKCEQKLISLIKQL